MRSTRTTPAPRIRPRNGWAKLLVIGCFLATVAYVVVAASLSTRRSCRAPHFSGNVEGRVWCPQCNRWVEGKWAVHEVDGRLVLPDCLEATP